MAEDEKDVKDQTEESSAEATEETPQEETPQEESKAVPYERFKEVNDQLKEFKEKVKNLTEDDKPEETTVEEKPSSPELSASDVLKLKNKGLSDEEILQLEEYSSKTRRPVHELVEDELVMGGLEKVREAKRSEQATPPPSASPKLVVGEKSVNEMSEREIIDNYDNLKSQFKGKGGK